MGFLRGVIALDGAWGASWQGRGPDVPFVRFGSDDAVAAVQRVSLGTGLLRLTTLHGFGLRGEDTEGLREAREFEKL